MLLRKPSSLRIVVLGYIVRCPIGGMAWHHLQYVLGLAQMGHEVLFLEDSGVEPWSCYNPQTGESGINPDYGLKFTNRVFARAGLAEHWAFNDRFTGSWRGPAATTADRFCSDADLVLNLSGANSLHGPLSQIGARVYVDTDPLFTQIRILKDTRRRQLAEEHNAFFSFGENLGSPACSIPEDGFPWKPTRQPVCLASWPVSPAPKASVYTTVMQWDSYANIEHNGQSYSMKSKSFGPYLNIPQRTNVGFEIALGSDTAPRKQLIAHGWRLRNPLEVTRDPWSYQNYIQKSRGEFSVAKHGYVASNSGWFSERSACYLATGRPVVVQDTGFSSRIETGEGLLAFSSPQQSLECLVEIESNYRVHCEAARAVAERNFEASHVLAHLIDRVFDSKTSGSDIHHAGASNG